MPSRALETPIGTLGLVGSDAGLSRVLWSAVGLAPEDGCAVLDETAAQLEAYFAGELTEFDLPLDLHGTDFQRRCWLALATIPYGQTVSYGEQARRLGLGPDAARAVGAANGQNPLPL
ncbi:MAG: methylated-DNA--[protein]-cysteine S-methyltransferase, partial [Gaiellaceae bacterium]